MANKKITDLVEITSAADVDVLAIVDVSADTTNKIKVDNLPISAPVQTALDAKQATITGAATTITSSDLTASKALVSDGSGKVAVSSVTSTELGYVSGVTSAIQTQVDAKLAKFDGSTYDINALACVTQAEYDALTPSSTTIYFIV